MEDSPPDIPTHPQGEVERNDERGVVEQSKAVETFGGRVFVRWDPDAAVTAFGPVTYFIEFLKTNGLWQQWVKECPLSYSSPNAPPKEDILGTILLSVLAGHKRYAHVATIRSDSVTPGLLGMKRVRSADAVRRAFLKLKGKYDFLLDFTPYLPADAQVMRPDYADTNGIIISALQGELGLKLESNRESVEVLVIDHVEKPSEN